MTCLPTGKNVQRALNREQHSLYNCLLSILDDTRFVDEIRALYPTLPVFVNLRCGLWYSESQHQTCYFKSTDGHFGNWNFSCVRLNLQVAKACSEHGGCIIIDATRRGKTFPVRSDSPLRAQRRTRLKIKLCTCHSRMRLRRLYQSGQPCSTAQRAMHNAHHRARV